MSGRPSTKLAPPAPKRSRGAQKYTPKCPPLTDAAMRDCLGGIRDHKFLSHHKGNRICADCRQRIAERTRNVSPLMTEPLRVAAGGGKPGDD